MLGVGTGYDLDALDALDGVVSGRGVSSLISRLDLAPAELAASACAGAFVAGVQGGDGGPTTTGVAAIVKHWVGYGASAEGFDGHNYYGRFSSFPGAAFDAHVDAFGDALTRRVAGVMPT